MTSLRFDNRFVRELPADPETGARRRQVEGALYSRVEPTPVRAPRLLTWSREVAELLDLDRETMESPEMARVLGGSGLLEGMQPYAATYGGHQFGHWAGQLGDGRAITLGETLNRRGERWELQLKGAGLTPYSRTADGRAVLRSSIREFLCSEAMHHLGVPTTRALSLVATGEPVVRDMFYDGHAKPEPGAIVCRVAPSFIRFGNFELPASRGDVDLLRRLIDFTIRRDYAALLPAPDAPIDEALRGIWFAEVCRRTAVMVAHWLRVGFVHGVMNTDNMSILGLTIDYGPYGWIDNYDPDWTPNTTDAEGRRYRFGQQAQIAYWNLGRLAGALLPAFASADLLKAGLERYVTAFESVSRGHVAAKFGLTECREEDVERMQALQKLLTVAEVDMTLFFRALGTFDAANPAAAIDQPAFIEAFYDDARRLEHRPLFAEWFTRHATRLEDDPHSRVEREAGMKTANPRYVLRNYLAQQAIDRAEAGDFAGIGELLEVMRRPYDDQPGREGFAARRPDWARQRAGCSMLSCSS